MLVVKHLGVILDSKLTWKEHLTSKYNKAVALFWQCKQIVGKTWGITPRIAHWIYIAVIRPMITHPACLAITGVYGAVKPCPLLELE